MRGSPLTRGGMLAAGGVGALTFLGAFFGWSVLGVGSAFLIVFGFFVTSVGLSRVGVERKRRLEEVEKGGPRDAWQVAANGGIATLCAIAAGIVALTHGAPRAAYALFWAFTGAYAVATADTWATEIGSAFGGVPRSIVGFAPVPRGRSGGVSLLGSIAMLAGAAWIGALWAAAKTSVVAFLIVTFAGTAGTLVDSLLGATLQRTFVCRGCDKVTEATLHDCGTPSVVRRGISWMTNDAVNALATFAGALVAGGLSLIA